MAWIRCCGGGNNKVLIPQLAWSHSSTSANNDSDSVSLKIDVSALKELKIGGYNSNGYGGNKITFTVKDENNVTIISANDNSTYPLTADISSCNELTFSFGSMLHAANTNYYAQINNISIE